MMNKVKTFLNVALLLGASLASAQDNLSRKADRYFDEFQYASAADAYEKVLAADPASLVTMERLALCYDKLNDPAKAETILERICANERVKPADLKLYAQVLAENGKYDASATWYRKYLALVPDEYANSTAASYGEIDIFFSDSSFYTLAPIAANSAESDFSPAFYQDGIIFCSARSTGKRGKTHGWNNASFIDLYFSNSDTSVVSVGRPINSPLHEGPATLTAGGDTIYFTRNNFSGSNTGTSNEGVVKLNIYFSVLKDGEWQKEQSLAFNHNEYATGHPALSRDGKMYFVSDKPGGFGGTDIYYVTKINGEWSMPVNLGEAINTTGNEMFPFISETGDLYFASNTLPGLGGLDIFCAKFENGQFTAPKNLGYPVNTSRDDFAMILRGNKGYFSSNRGDDPKDDNIYQITINKIKPVSIVAVDENGNPLANYTLAITTGSSSRTEKVVSAYKENLNCEQAYSIECSLEGYLSRTTILSTDQLKKLKGNDVIRMVLSEAARVVGIELQTMDGKKLNDGQVEVVDRAGNKIPLTKDASGMMTASLKTLDEYQITGSRKDFKTKTVGLKGTELKLMGDKPVVTVFLVPAEALFEKNVVGETIELEIRYDLGKATIRPDAARELDKLVAFMKKNPKVVVELGSHTDTRGSNEANLKLSQKRAESAVRYLVSKGVSSKMLVPIGYGEDDLKIQDATTEEEHQHNRRTTVKIVAVK